jgi:hypothetical protein
MINKLFGINNYKTMYFGASLFDVNNFNATQDQIAYIYDNLNKIPRGFFPEIFTGTLWMTGATNLDNEWRETIKTNERCYEITRTHGFIHTSEFLRKKDDLPFILSHLRWYGNRSIYREDCESNQSLYDNQILQKCWSVSPLSVRYYAKMSGNGNSPDYLYLLGGNDFLFKEDNYKQHNAAFYGLYRYLTLAKTKLSFDHVYERVGSVENKLCIDYVIDSIKERLR